MAFDPELSLAGSQIGYNADIDNSSSSSSDDDASSKVNNSSNCSVTSETACSTEETTSTSSSIPLQFYQDVKPRRRRHLRCRHQLKKVKRQRQDATHPDIDLSLVSLLTSKEHDRRQFKKLQKALLCSGDSTLQERLRRFSSRNTTNEICHRQRNKMSIEDESSSPFSSSDGSDNVMKTEREYFKAFSVSHKNNRPYAVIDYGSVQFGQLGSILDSVYKIDSVKNGDGKEDSFLVDANDVKPAANFSPQPALTVASSRSSDVAAVIASLKNPSTDMKRKATREDRSVVKKVKFLPTAIHNTDATTLDDAVAFSPYARVLFTANFPQTVVYINAAYGTLVKKGFANQCALGHRLRATNICSRSFEDSFKLSKETASKIVTHDLGISTKDANYQLFPIISGDESFCDYSQTYSSCEPKEAAKHKYVVSHYLLQIEPVTLS